MSCGALADGFVGPTMASMGLPVDVLEAGALHHSDIWPFHMDICVLQANSSVMDRGLVLKVVSAKLTPGIMSSPPAARTALPSWNPVWKNSLRVVTSISQQSKGRVTGITAEW